MPLYGDHLRGRSFSRRSFRRAFTLIELLVVIAIIAILAVVVVLVLNPAQLLAQSRDANRVSDMATLNSAISLYISDQSASPSYSLGTSSIIYVSVPDPLATGSAGDQCQGLGLPVLPSGYTYHCAASSTYRMTDGTGWFPIDFKSVTSGSPIGSLPVDPVNVTSSDLYYTYETDGTGGYKLTAFFESKKDAPLMANDGGIDPSLYERGSDLALFDGRGLIGYWPLDDGSGVSAADLSGGGNNGTLSGTPDWNSAGKVGGDFIFNGSSSFNMGTAPLFNVSGSVTIAGWVNASSINPNDADDEILGKVYSYPSPTAYRMKGSQDCTGVNLEDNILFGISADGTTIIDRCSNTIIQTGTWYFVTGVYDASVPTLHVYVNGVLDDGPLHNGTVVPSAIYDASGTPMTMGTLYGDPSGAENWHGQLDDMRVYDRALSSAEIMELYNAEK